MNEINVDEKTRDLTDKDFYQQACSYFYYHAEQRTTMINFFIAVFAACIALYGSLIKEYSLASFLISLFLFIVSRLFYSIDIRNRFDVKHSQSVIAQIERDYEKDLLKTDAEYVYGVFSNEDNIFKFYGREKRREAENKEYRKIRRLYKIKKIKKLLRCKSAGATEIEFNKKKTEFLDGVETISEKEFMESLSARSIRSLTNSIRDLYYLCMIISLLGLGFAGIMTFFPEWLNIL